MKSKYNVFLIFSVVLLAVIFIIENINHRFWLNDFKVYYEAAKALRNGESVYNNLFALGSGYYKYSPFTLLLFVPFTLLPYKIAAILQYLILSSCIIGTFIIGRTIFLRYIFPENIKEKNAWLYFSFLACANHFVRELHLGNINVILLFLLTYTLSLLLNHKQILAGILFGLVIITKPFFGILILPLLFRRKFKFLLAFCISILWFTAGPALVLGIPENMHLHSEWLQTMLSHNEGFPSSNTIDYLIRQLPFNFEGARTQIAILASFVILMIAWIIYHLKNEKEVSRSKSTSHLISEWFVLTAILPNLFKTDTQHFLLSLPVIMMLTGYLTINSRLPIIILCTILLICFGGNSTDLLGHRLSESVNAMGILGISNLLIIVTFIFIIKKQPKQSTT